MCIEKKALNNSIYILNKVSDMTPGWALCRYLALCKFLVKRFPVEVPGACSRLKLSGKPAELTPAFLTCGYAKFTPVPRASECGDFADFSNLCRTIGSSSGLQ